MLNFIDIILVFKMSYVPPHMRNKQVTSEPAPANTERSNPFHRERRQPRRPYEKPQWQIEKDRADAEAEAELEKKMRGMENTEENFPTLCAPVTKTVTWGGERKFTDLASEWREDDTRRKEEEEEEKRRAEDIERYRNERNTYSNSNFVLPRFRNVRRFEEPEDQERLDENETTKPAEQFGEDETGWTVVERKIKVKREKTFEELEAEYQKDLEEGTNDDTVWAAGPEEHETCWDERRH
jgi:hypothetical protein